MLRSRSCPVGRSGEIGIRSRLKICRYLVSWGFKSPLRHPSSHLITMTYRPNFLLCVPRVLSFWATSLSGRGRMRANFQRVIDSPLSAPIENMSSFSEKICQTIFGCWIPGNASPQSSCSPKRCLSPMEEFCPNDSIIRRVLTYASGFWR